MKSNTILLPVMQRGHNWQNTGYMCIVLLSAKYNMKSFIFSRDIKTINIA
jgi:hypothetical protein